MGGRNRETESCDCGGALEETANKSKPAAKLMTEGIRKMRFTRICGLVILLTAMPLVDRAFAADVTASSNPALSGQPVTFTVQIESPSGVTATPTGTVTFTDSGQGIGSAPLVSGMASVTVQFGLVGDHTIVAEYSGDADFRPASSPPFTEHVIDADVFTLSVAPSIIKQRRGESSAAQVTLFSNASAAKPVHLSCEDLPPGTACSFGQDAITPGASGATTNLTIASTAAQTAKNGVRGPGGTYAVLLVPLLLFVRKRRYLPVLALSVSLMLLSGCGGSRRVLQGGTPSGAYSIHVIGSDGVDTQQALVQFNVR